MRARVKIIALQQEQSQALQEYHSAILTCSYQYQHFQTDDIALIHKGSDDKNRMSTIPVMYDCTFENATTDKAWTDCQSYLSVTNIKTADLIAIGLVLKSKKLAESQPHKDKNSNQAKFHRVLCVPVDGFRGWLRFGPSISLLVSCDNILPLAINPAEHHQNQAQSEVSHDSGYHSDSTGQTLSPISNPETVHRTDIHEHLVQLLTEKENTIHAMQSYIDKLLGLVLETNPQLLERISILHSESLQTLNEMSEHTSTKTSNSDITDALPPKQI